jgi:hypothetical protein
MRDGASAGGQCGLESSMPLALRVCCGPGRPALRNRPAQPNRVRPRQARSKLVKPGPTWSGLESRAIKANQGREEGAGVEGIF